MNIGNSVILNTKNLNEILKQIDFDELRENKKIEFKEKNDNEQKKESIIINYSWKMDDTTEIIPFAANITIQESYEGISEPIAIDIEFSPEDILSIITEYFSWMSIPYKATGVTECTKMDGKSSVSGSLDFGNITVKIEKILTKKRKK